MHYYKITYKLVMPVINDYVYFFIIVFYSNKRMIVIMGMYDIIN